MGRPKKFSREGVLQKVLPLFWKYGFAGTSLQQLERASGVNKSGLYAEFGDKEDLFLHTLLYYYEHRGALQILTAEPKSYGNIERFLRLGDAQDDGCVGCFSVNSLREFPSLSDRVREVVGAYHHRLIPQIIENIEAEPHHLPAATIATIVTVFFAGYCIERNLPAEAEGDAVGAFMQALRLL
ncbi:TetR/AcrR family transcriptional regulator [Burkholderia sp. BCCIQ04A]|uniref:TetR/AcrR family transcriptional regulator n=1 Tax=Burkholderia anthinoferrum TaxID=3090833 RepID=A0ABU5WQ05_9BURK|nr:MULTISPECIES: TetR/AcrR family transcriptional regulator [Burkholderia]MEB2504276.1 TetR/AcrR family transcriptional regulator [Burkholderia anthinoferrum]MEB2531402.1 TetR/AcrR family transcriptional regulator [Burkholderia anthinoferrum]MEB2561325.1 TetR/AcrR family transcriptional regulator [Burkholderia anthinoferrum]MEB2581026.1 TetR/AcrR family transcriptional regulator [Burkholderia anthinoferrum]KVH07162.1 TetR family transcriptional regulator [Burkholderia anthina]